ncbi:hypothetical protein [Aquabacter spiritensis]|uniref:BASS family bile acid:Na+ symporter n=1 Tax=Aquabacter spiritensis TaxID=933073 RepID=A0A4R3LN92_9HYPH|nr:hypothetical protein [Aquabacter spiritensis]TCT01591.1 BASS family bile acid:Na+ symporter [Aquabacter spiritensis]
MPPYHPLSLLAALGRHGPRAIAASIFLGLLVPPAAALAKPLLLPCIVALLVISFLRTDLGQVRRGRHGRAVLFALVWIMGVLPAVFGYIVSTLLPPSDNGILLALMMQAAGPPIMSTPAFAAMLGLDATLSLAVMVSCLVAVPFTAPVLVAFFTDGALTLDGVALAGRLAVILAGTAGAGLGLRAGIGRPRIAAWNDHLNGINVLLLLVMAVAFMDGVTAYAIADPLLVASLTGLAFLVTLVGLISTLFVFRWVGGGQDVIMGYAAGNRNLGLMVAATGGLLPETTWLYVALAQFPIYLLPYLLRPLILHLTRPPAPL